MEAFLSKIFNKFSIAKKDIVIAERFFKNELQIPSQNSEEDTFDPYLRDTIFEIYSTILENFDAIEYNARNGIYLGTAGIAYLFYRLSKSRLFEDRKMDLLRNAKEYTKVSVNEAVKNLHKIKYAPSFLLGNCGIYAVSAVIYKALNITWLTDKYYKMYLKGMNVSLKENFLKCGSDELFVGRAGCILGYLWLSKEIEKQLDIKKLYKICDIIILSGLSYSQKHKCQPPLMYSYYKYEYVGAAHGLTTILLVLLLVPNYLDLKNTYKEYVKQTIDCILELQDEEGNFPIRFIESKNSKNDLTQWCHGCAGVIYLMAKAYMVWKEEKYLNCCNKICANIWMKGLLTKGPGLCHGVSGNGYAFLLMYRLTSDESYLQKAIAFANFISGNEFKKQAKVPDNPYSLFEGLAGTACFLSDVAEPVGAAFPFLDIFSVYSTNV